MFTAFLTSDDYLLFDFTSHNASERWFVVNDDVMGGRSSGNIQVNSEGIATFSGKLSPENNGGFSSIRTFIQNNHETQYKGVKIRLRGDGKIYSLRFRTDRNFDGYAYQAKIKTETDTWKVYEIPFDDFNPTFRGWTLSDKPPLKSDQIVQFGLLIGDKQFGEFVVEIDWVSLY